MKTVGIICEYNPFHLGHLGHIEKTKQIIGSDVAVICVMSGNYVQRGDLAVFNKFARARMAIASGADLVIELPTPYVLQSAEGFARAGVFILDKLGVCDYLSFGSESGEIDLLLEAASIIESTKANMITKEWLERGVSYASAQQKAADTLLGDKAHVFKSPNNVLGIEYLKAINSYGSSLKPITILRTGGDHDGDTGFSASSIRKALVRGEIPLMVMPETAHAICLEESISKRGPVSIGNAELAIMSRLRAIDDYFEVPGVSEGLESRFKRFASKETSVSSILNKVKTKRYTMSRLRRILICATLGIKKEHIKSPPPYIRVLAMNSKGMKLLGVARKKTRLPVITKPASVHKQNESVIRTFNLETSATDFYVLNYSNEEERIGGQEWLHSPIIIK